MPGSVQIFEPSRVRYCERIFLVEGADCAGFVELPEAWESARGAASRNNRKGERMPGKNLYGEVIRSNPCWAAALIRNKRRQGRQVRGGAEATDAGQGMAGVTSSTR